MIKYIFNYFYNIFNTNTNTTKEEITTIESDIFNIEKLIITYENQNVELFSMKGDYIEMKENLQKLIIEINSKKNCLKALEDDLKGQESFIDKIYNEKIKTNIPKLIEYKKQLEMSADNNQVNKELIQKIIHIINYCNM